MNNKQNENRPMFIRSILTLWNDHTLRLLLAPRQKRVLLLLGIIKDWALTCLISGRPIRVWQRTTTLCSLRQSSSQSITKFPFALISSLFPERLNLYNTSEKALWIYALCIPEPTHDFTFLHAHLLSICCHMHNKATLNSNCSSADSLSVNLRSSFH